MSPCENYQELISRMVDGDLSAKEEADLARHIESCPDCAALYHAFSAISNRIGEDLEESPFDLRDNVMAEIHRAEIRRRNRIPNILRSVLSVAACVALIVGVYLGVSITQGKNLVTSAFDAGSASEQKVTLASVESRELPKEEAAPAVEESAAGKSADAPMLQSNAALTPQESERPALTMDAAAGAASEDRTAEEPAAEEAVRDDAPADAPESEEAEEPTLEEWELRGWDLSLLRELLKGSPDERSAEEMEPYCFGQILVRNVREEYCVLLYERDGALYYLDPVEDSVYRSAMTVEELRLFLGA